MIVKSIQDEIQNYLADASNTKGFCDSVYFPENENDIISILKEADKKKIPITISGNRTGLTGACVPNGGIVISTEKLNKVIEINYKEMFALVEPGVLLSDFQKILADYGLFYPPDPTEANCFIGGTVATNASGAQTFKYGATRDFVLGLNIILPQGEKLSLDRGKNFADGFMLELLTEEGKVYKLQLPEYNMPEVKNASGYYCKKDMDAVDLFIGSEGTLGIVTKIKLKLLKKPENIISAVLFFNSEEDALKFLFAAKGKSLSSRKKKTEDDIDALALEYFDENALRFLRDDYEKIPGDSKAAIWFEQEVNETN
ncbi:MAG TPA: FAD-binding oxidoreductase, partial [Ignavibacteriaceae bacterium]